MSVSPRQSAARVRLLIACVHTLAPCGVPPNEQAAAHRSREPFGHGCHNSFCHLQPGPSAHMHHTTTALAHVCHLHLPSHAVPAFFFSARLRSFFLSESRETWESGKGSQVAKQTQLRPGVRSCALAVCACACVSLPRVIVGTRALVCVRVGVDTAPAPGSGFAGTSRCF